VEKGGREGKEAWLEMVATFSPLEEQNFGLHK
jgi:hypothetical protein